MKSNVNSSEGIFKQFKIRDLFKSLKAHFFVSVFLTGLACLITMHVLFIDSYENSAVSGKCSEVQTQLRILANHIITHNYLQDTSEEVINAEIDVIANSFDGRILVVNDDLQVVKDTYAISNGKTIISEEVVRCLKKGTRGGTSYKYDKKDDYIQVVVPIVVSEMIQEGDVSTAGDGKEVVRGVILASVSPKTIHATMKVLNKRAGIVEGILIIAILCLGALMAHNLYKPFDTITTAINEVKAGYTEDYIEAPDFTEARHIVEAFNALLRRMKVLDDSRQEFVSNVSHELKTPITSMKVLADSILSMGDGVPNEIYKDFMEDIGKEVDRESKIITDLLALVKMDKKDPNLEVSNVDIEALIGEVLKRIKPIALQRNIELIFVSKRPVTAEVDELKISNVITNLVENAVKYTNDNGEVKVILDADHQFFIVKVIDNGVGIPEDCLEHIFERFYRVDKARSREIGGTGLGLAIAKSVVLLHRGTIDVESKVGVGTKFTVKIPLIMAAER